MSTEQRLTIKEVADTLQCDRQTVRRWIGQGQLRAYRYGKRFIRIDPKDLEAFREQVSPTTYLMTGHRSK